MIQDKQGLLYHACRVHVCTRSACECMCLPPLPPLPGALGCLQACALPGTLSPLYAVRRGCRSLAVNGACLALCRLAPSVALASAVAVRVAVCHVLGTPRRSSKLPLNPQTGLPHWPQIIRIRSASLVLSAVGAPCGAPCSLTLSRPPWWLSVVLCYTSLSQNRYNALADRLHKFGKPLSPRGLVFG